MKDQQFLNKNQINFKENYEVNLEKLLRWQLTVNAAMEFNKNKEQQQSQLHFEGSTMIFIFQR